MIFLDLSIPIYSSSLYVKFKNCLYKNPLDPQNTSLYTSTMNKEVFINKYQSFSVARCHERDAGSENNLTTIAA